MFSLIFVGSGNNGAWTTADWNFYYDHRSELWYNPQLWLSPDPRDWDSFSLHVNRLASHYGPDEKEKFIRDFALVWGGISQEKSWAEAAFEAGRGPVQPFLNEGNERLRSEYLDINESENQSHHYAGIFFLAYYTDYEIAMTVNYLRDTNNPGDMNLGNTAAYQAYFFRYYFYEPSALAQLIDGLSQ